MDQDEFQKRICTALERLATAVKYAGAGDDTGPGAIEALGMAIGGKGLESNLRESVDRVASSIADVAEALHHIADVLSARKE